MHRVDTPTGLFSDGTEPNTGTPLVSAEANTWQEELAYICEQEGLTLDPEDDTQVHEAVQNMVDRRVMPFSETYGCTLANNMVDYDHDITISAGRRCSDDGTTNMVLASSITKRIDAAWAEGTVQGGLDTGSVAANTWYYVYLIKNPTTGVVDGLFSISLSPSMPSGFTKKRLLESVLTDGSANIIRFIQWDDCMMWKDPPMDHDATVSNNNAVSLVLSTPTGRQVEAVLNVLIIPAVSGQTGYVYISPYDQDDEETSREAAPLCTLSGGYETAYNDVSKINIKTNTSSAIRMRAYFSGSFLTYRIVTLGWKSQRGR
ncbi:hypothetical protein PITCH_A2000009 [uncultured Desulfobacterium sp.]|uniref:Uncharacterized protein n=1 Tax=uncultured Desulfobacterium sp. TaxID=201089 RepID=A0A445MWI2_9BACT|nr:hypothetical protein PITCH_A2000009 [uncultured Desulfobacterium sp.]